MLSKFSGKVLRIGADGKVYISRDGIKEYSFPAKRLPDDIKAAKYSVGAELDTVLEPAVFLTNTADDGGHPDAVGGWDNYYVMFDTQDGIYSGIVKTKITERGKAFADITEIQKESDINSTHGVNKTSSPPAMNQSLSYEISVTPQNSGVNTSIPNLAQSDTMMAGDMGSGANGLAVSNANGVGKASQPALYLAETPKNIEYPHVPLIELDYKPVLEANGGQMPKKGNYLRDTFVARANKKLGLDKLSEIYIPVSNVMRNGDEYVLQINKNSVRKMLSPNQEAGNNLPIESLVVLDNIERIANNGVWFESQGDKRGRDQIQGFDHLKTSIYIESVPYEVDMRVKLVQNKGDALKNNLYYFTPEEILSIKKIGAPSNSRAERVQHLEKVMRVRLLLKSTYHKIQPVSIPVYPILHKVIL